MEYDHPERFKKPKIKHEKDSVANAYVRLSPKKTKLDV